MTEKQERRNRDAKRVTVETLVEVCGGARSFEAESINISGTGMQVRTAYLPEEGAPLVCRFHERGREVVVEGVVAWRNEGTRGGEFGVRFTALDSRGVDVLRELAGYLPIDEEPGADEESVAPAPEPVRAAGVGAQVRLHIAGLGAPMKARVRDASRRRVKVGSKLEFLKVGRELELEDLGQGQRRTARIDGVDVTLDPETQIPQLVVALRFNDIDETPEPSVVDAGRGASSAERIDPRNPAQERSGLRSAKAPPLPVTKSTGSQKLHPPPIPKGAEKTVASARSDADRAAVKPSGAAISSKMRAPADSAADVEEGEWEGAEEVAAEVNAIRGRLGAWALGAGAATDKAGHGFAKAGAQAVRRVRGFFANVRALGAADVSDASPRRQTAPPPAGPLKADGRRPATSSPHLRSQSAGKVPGTSQPAKAQSSTSAKPPPAKPKLGKSLRRVAVAGGALTAVATLSFVLWGNASAPPGELAAAAGNPATLAVVTKANAPAEVTKTPAPEAEAPPRGGIVADVPLFGATPMATMEPAALGAPPMLDDESAGEEARERAAAAVDKVDDDLWPREKQAAKDEGSKGSDGHGPADVAPWGRGRLHLPTIHRLRLDAPGDAVLGAMNPSGFSVVIPRRKVMEDGQLLKKRDNRIAKIRTRNIGAGAEVTVQFRSEVPPYRVRLRRDFVEFLISAPEGTK